MNRIMTVILTVSFVLPIPTSILAVQQSANSNPEGVSRNALSSDSFVAPDETYLALKWQSHYASHVPPSRGTPGRTISGGTR
jgi:hypothetical protein